MEKEQEQQDKEREPCEHPIIYFMADSQHGNFSGAICAVCSKTWTIHDITEAIRYAAENLWAE